MYHTLQYRHASEVYHTMVILNQQTPQSGKNIQPFQFIQKQLTRRIYFRVVRDIHTLQRPPSYCYKSINWLLVL